MTSNLAQLFRSLRSLFGAGKSKRQSPSSKTTETQPLVLSPAQIESQPFESFPDASRRILTWRTLISAPATATSKLIAGIATCPATESLTDGKEGHLRAHRHEQPEIYYIIAGRGLMEIEGNKFEVEKGALLYIPGNAEHGIKNIDKNEDLIWLYVFPGDEFEEVVYRFTGEDYRLV